MDAEKILGWTRLVDEGFFTWTLSALKPFLWTRYAEKVVEFGGVFLSDGPPLERTRIFPKYQFRRRSQDRELQRVGHRERRKLLSSLLGDIYGLKTYRVWGMETDDLVALLVTFGGVQKVVGRDKDYRILRSMGAKFFTIGGNPQKKDFAEPFSLGPLELALRGDRADGVPLICKIKDWRRIRKSDKPYTQAFEEFGDAFLFNLELVLLPAPFALRAILGDEAPTVMEILPTLNRGTYLQDLRYAFSLHPKVKGFFFSQMEKGDLFLPPTST